MREIADGLCVEDDGAQQEDSQEGSSVNASWPRVTPAEAKAQDTGYDEEKGDTIDVVLGPGSHHPLHPSVLGRQWEHLQ